MIVIVASIDFEGFANIFRIAYEGGRIPQQYEFDPRYRHTFWTVLIGNCTGAEMASFVCQQYKDSVLALRIPSLVVTVT